MVEGLGLFMYSHVLGFDLCDELLSHLIKLPDLWQNFVKLWRDLSMVRLTRAAPLICEIENESETFTFVLHAPGGRSA